MPKQPGFCLKISIFFMLSLLLLLWSTRGVAQEEKDGTKNKTGDKTLSPYFFVEGRDSALESLPLKATDVSVNINGVIADVTITQKYANEGAVPIHASYIFPASTRSAVHGMKMVIGERVITAKIKERQVAQQEFNQARQAGKSASLLEQQRPNVFSMNVANIMPGDTIDIELKYTELLIPAEGTYAFVFPTVVGPRYSDQPEGPAPEADLWIKNPYLKAGTPSPAPFNITVNLTAGMAIQEVACRTHPIDIDWDSQEAAYIRLSNPSAVAGDRDYILTYRLAGRQIQSGLMLYEGEEEKFFLLMMQPPERIRPEEIPPREYIFVVDVSGSMNGFPLNTSKELLRNLIGYLKDTDTFNLHLFAGGSSVMAPASVAATKKNIDQAIALLDRQQGGGGTELCSALQRALELPRDEAYSRTVIIATDGYIGGEKDVFRMVENNLNRTNVFAFGIGSSVNRYLIEGLAKAGRGEPFIVTQPKESKKEAERFRRYVSSPVLTGITVNYRDFQAYDVEPAQIPDLFAQRPIIIFGKWRGSPEGRIEITGAGGTGPFSQTFDVMETVPGEVNSALPYLWARSRIARLSDYNSSPQNSENKAEVTSLGLTYNLLTAYTSFIAVYDVIRNQEGAAKDIKQPVPLPAGVSNLAVSGGYRNVPEPSLMGMLMLLTALWIFTKRNKGRTCQ